MLRYRKKTCELIMSICADSFFVILDLAWFQAMPEFDGEPAQ